MAQLFNACEYLLDRRLAAGDGQRIALTGPAGDLSYARAARPGPAHRGRAAGGRRAAGAAGADGDVGLAGLRGRLPGRDAGRRDPGACVDDAARRRHRRTAPGFPGPVSRGHSRVRRRGGVGCRGGARTGRGTGGFPASCQSPGRCTCSSELAAAAPDDVVYDTSPDSPAFWLYTSGTTGTPKGAMHRHGSVQVVCETYGHPGARHQAGRPVPVGGQGLLRLRPGQLGAVPAVGGRGGGAERRRRRDRTSSRRGRQVRRDACSSAARRSSPTCCAPGCPPDALAGRPARRVGGGGAARGALRALDVALRRSTSSTASG